MFLEFNGVDAASIANDQVYDPAVSVAAGSHDVDEIAGMIRSANGDR